MAVLIQKNSWSSESVIHLDSVLTVLLMDGNTPQNTSDEK